MPLLDLSSYKVTNAVSGLDATVQDSMIDAIQAVVNALTNANIDPAAAISASKLAGYPTDVTKLLAGDGSWRTIRPQGYVDLGTIANSSTITIDASLGDTFRAQLNGATQTWANPTNPATGQKITLMILQNGFGTTAFTWGTAWKLAGGSWIGSGASGQYGTIGFVYDGAAWRELGRAQQIPA